MQGANISMRHLPFWIQKKAPEFEPMAESRIVKITNERGLHARAAAKFSKMAELYDANITVINGNLSAPGNSIMELLMLGAAMGCDIEITAHGPEAAKAIDALCSLVTDKFGESR